MSIKKIWHFFHMYQVISSKKLINQNVRIIDYSISYLVDKSDFKQILLPDWILIVYQACLIEFLFGKNKETSFQEKKRKEETGLQ